MFSRRFSSLFLVFLFSAGLFFVVSSTQMPQVYATVPIALVQGPYSNATLGLSITATLGSNPATGNTLILSVGDHRNTDALIISQVGVTWSQVANSTNYTMAHRPLLVIYHGVVSAGASKTVNVSITSGFNAYLEVNLAEYSGITGFDANATDSGGTDPGLSTAYSGTANASAVNSLYIAAFSYYAVSGYINPSSITNGYSLLANASQPDMWGNAFLHKISTEKTTVPSTTNTSITITGTATYWAGALVIFTGAPPSYSITGPYYEDNGYVAPTALNVSVTYSTGETEVFVLNGTLGVAESFYASTGKTPVVVRWQATSSINYTRLIYLTNTTSANLIIFIPNPAATVQIYQFTITDFGNMVDPYLISAIVVDGNLTQQQYIIERKPITVSSVSLIMEQWHQYYLVLQCTAGSYTFLFSAENSYLTNLNSGPLLFPYPSPQYNFTAVAEALNSTCIRTSYADYDNVTAQLSVMIWKGQGNFQTIDYDNTITNFNVTYPSGVYILDWNSMVSTNSYAVSVNATRNGVVYSWTYAIVASNTSPFAGIFNFLGTWPNGVDPAQIIGAIFVVLAGVGIFSYFGTAMGCAFSWIIAGILSVIGWFTVSVPMFVFAGVITFFIYVDEGKKTVRET